jgi:hypothetical protein
LKLVFFDRRHYAMPAGDNRDCEEGYVCDQSERQPGIDQPAALDILVIRREQAADETSWIASQLTCRTRELFGESRNESFRFDQ